MPNLGVHVYEKATAVSTPVVANSGIPFVVGLAPVHTAAKPTRANSPVLCTSWAEAAEKLGFSYDWKTYSLCEFMYAHFQLYGCQPVIFCNVMDPSTMQKAMETKEHTIIDHKISLPFDTIANRLKVSVPGADDPAALKLDEDYAVLYDEDKAACIVELLNSGSAYDAAALTVSGSTVTPDVMAVADIVSGLSMIDACMSTAGVIPDLICAPGWSHNSVVAAVMATKAAGINGLFRAKALIDMDCGESGVRDYSELVPAKNKNNFVDENQILCWPMVKLGDYQFHMSTHLAGLMAKVDTDNAGVPYESPSNKCYKMDGCCLGDGTVEQAEPGLWAEKYVVIAMPKSIKPGTIAPASAAEVSGEFDVYYYAAYQKGKQLWEIDKRNLKCVVGGVDYTAGLRKALGK